MITGWQIWVSFERPLSGDEGYDREPDLSSSDWVDITDDVEHWELSYGDTETFALHAGQVTLTTINPKWIEGQTDAYDLQGRMYVAFYFIEDGEDNDEPHKRYYYTTSVGIYDGERILLHGLLDHVKTDIVPDGPVWYWYTLCKTMDPWGGVNDIGLETGQPFSAPDDATLLEVAQAMTFIRRAWAGEGPNGRILGSHWGELGEQHPATSPDLIPGSEDSSTVLTRLDQPTFTATSLNTGLRLTWSAITGAQGYAIYKDRVVVVDNQTALTWTDTEVEDDTEYAYAVQALGDFLTTSNSLTATTAVTYDQPAVQLTQPTMTFASTADGVVVTFTHVPNATAYKLFVNGTQHGKDLATTVTSVTYGDAVHNTAYNFAVQAVGNGNTHTDSASTATSYTYDQPVQPLSAPANFTAASRTGGIELSWDRVAQADGYTIGRSPRGWATSITSRATLTALDDTVVDGSTYTYTIHADGSGLYSDSPTSTVTHTWDDPTPPPAPVTGVAALPGVIAHARITVGTLSNNEVYNETGNGTLQTGSDMRLEGTAQDGSEATITIARIRWESPNGTSMLVNRSRRDTTAWSYMAATDLADKAMVLASVQFIGVSDPTDIRHDVKKWRFVPDDTHSLQGFSSIGSGFIRWSGNTLLSRPPAVATGQTIYLLVLDADTSFSTIRQRLGEEYPEIVWSVQD